MDLDAATDQLYGGSPDDFIARRKELAGAARKAGDRELAQQITQLRRPTRTGWLVNLLAHQAPDDVEGLLALGRELGEAQQRGSGTDLRRLSQQRRTVVDRLALQAVQLGRDHDYRPPEAAIQEVAQTLQAALGDAEVAELVRRGRLTQAVTYGGFGPSSDLSAALAASLPNQPSDQPSDRSGPEPDPAAAEPVEDTTAADEHRQAARRAADEAQAEWDRTRDELTAGEAEAEQTTRTADELTDEVEQLRDRLQQTEADEKAAREQARAARKRLTELRHAAAGAEKAAHAAAADLDD